MSSCMKGEGAAARETSSQRVVPRVAFFPDSPCCSRARVWANSLHLHNRSALAPTPAAWLHMRTGKKISRDNYS